MKLGEKIFFVIAITSIGLFLGQLIYGAIAAKDPVYAWLTAIILIVGSILIYLLAQALKPPAYIDPLDIVKAKKAELHAFSEALMGKEKR